MGHVMGWQKSDAEIGEHIATLPLMVEEIYHLEKDVFSVHSTTIDAQDSPNIDSLKVSSKSDSL